MTEIVKLYLIGVVSTDTHPTLRNLRKQSTQRIILLQSHTLGLEESSLLHKQTPPPPELPSGTNQAGVHIQTIKAKMDNKASSFHVAAKKIHQIYPSALNQSVA